MNRNKIEVIGHGENSITFQLFSEIDKRQLCNILSKYSIWSGKSPVIKEDDIEEVHLFPGFGKKVGYGEPDAIILLRNTVIYIEIELIKLDKHISSNFVKQLQKFIVLADDIKNSKLKRIRNVFIGESGYKFRGGSKLRSLFKHIKKEHREPYFLVISDSENSKIDANILKNRITVNKKDFNLGWITFRKIKKMKKVSLTAKCINYNLKM